MKQLSNAIPIINLENAKRAKVFEKAVIMPANEPSVLPREKGKFRDLDG